MDGRSGIVGRTLESGDWLFPPARKERTVERVEFRILGPLEVVEVGDGARSLGGPKQRTVLAHLILRANRVVPTDRLAHLLLFDG